MKILILVVVHSFYVSHSFFVHGWFVFCLFFFGGGGLVFIFILFQFIAFIANFLVFLIHPLILLSFMFAPYGFFF